jgi:hypothetical protein
MHRIESLSVPSFEYPVPLQPVSVLNRNVGAHRQLLAYLSMTTAGVWDAMVAAAWRKNQYTKQLR